LPLYPNAKREPACGEVWQWRGRLRVDTDAILFVRGQGRLLQSAGPINMLKQAAEKSRQECSRLLSLGIEEEDVRGVIQALILGYSNQLMPDDREKFKLTGSMHVFAISGLHSPIMNYLRL
jgi:competence protein ComEC